MKYVIKQGKHVIHSNPHNLSKEELKCARDALSDEGGGSCIFADLRAAQPTDKADIQRQIAHLQRSGKLPRISKET